MGQPHVQQHVARGRLRQTAVPGDRRHQGREESRRRGRHRRVQGGPAWTLDRLPRQKELSARVDRERLEPNEALDEDEAWPTALLISGRPVLGDHVRANRS